MSLFSTVSTREHGGDRRGMTGAMAISGVHYAKRCNNGDIPKLLPS
jgi:hypothetical protein